MVKLSTRKVIIAMNGTGAVIAAIARNCKVTRKALYEFLEKNPELKKDLENERERTLDEYEEVLKAIATNGALKDSTTLGAVKYYLNNKGRKRGYIDKQEIETKLNIEGIPVSINIIKPDETN